MITEDLLREALAVEAERYDVPPDGPAAILDAAETPRPRWRPSMPRPVYLAGGAMAAIVGIAVLGAVVADKKDTPSVSVAGPDSFQDSGSRNAGVPHPEVGAVEPGTSAQHGPLTPALPSAAPVPASKPMPPQKLIDTVTETPQRAARDDARVIRTGQIQLEVPEGKVGAVADELALIASRYRGYVATSQTVTAGDHPSAKVSLRVPVASFDGLIGNVLRLGKPLSQSSQGQDVTAQFADNEARLRALVASRTQFQTLLTRARSIGEILAVQQQITQVQTQIEQLQGQQKLLTDRTTYATLEIALAEPGETVIDLTAKERKGFAKAWDDSRDNFTGGLIWVVAASGTIGFLVLLLAAVSLVVHAGWRLWSRRAL